MHECKQLIGWRLHMRPSNPFRHQDPIKVKNYMQTIHLNKRWFLYFELDVILEVKTWSWKDII
jgi:hypothetical protein